MVSVRLEPDTRRRIENYAEVKGITKSAAMRRLLNKGADLEDAGIAVAASTIENNQGTRAVQPEEDEEKDLKADGGAVIRPILQFLGAFYAGSILVMFSFIAGLVVGFKFPLIPYGELAPVIVSISVILALIMMMLYTEVPEKIDLVIRDKVNIVSQKFGKWTDPV